MRLLSPLYLGLVDPPLGFVSIRKQFDQNTIFEINRQEADACAGSMPTIAPDGDMTFSVVAGKTWTSQQDQQISRVASLISLAKKYRPIIDSLTSEMPWRVKTMTTDIGNVDAYISKRFS